MTRTVIAFYAGESPENGANYEGTFGQLDGVDSLIVENYTAVNMVVETEQIPPITRKSIVMGGVNNSMRWHIVKPVGFTIQGQYCRAIAGQKFVSNVNEPLYPVSTSYCIQITSGSIATQYVASVLVLALLINEWNWGNPVILGVRLAWNGIVFDAAQFFKYRFHHTDAAAVPLFQLPGGSGSIILPLPGVASIVTPSMVAQPAGASVSISVDLGWVTI